MSAAARRPVAAALAGAVCIAFSAILVRLAEVSPVTAAFARCAYAVPVLLLLATLEDRRVGPRPSRERWLAAGAGVLFAADLITWHYAIRDVGAGLATVLGNLQVVLVGLLAWAVLGERPPARAVAAVPVVLFGVILISGVVGSGAYGDNPARGAVFGVLTAITYSAFILMLRHAGSGPGRVAGPLSDATAVAAVSSLAAGPFIGDIDLLPGAESVAWLATLAITSQVVGWLLIGASLPRLPAALASVLLTLQPVGSVVLGVVLLSEAPSALQVTGVGIVLAGIVGAVIGRRAPPPAPAHAGT